MDRAAVSVLVFAIYLLGVGVALILAPNAVLSLFDLPLVSDAWIRVVGMLMLLLAYYYGQAARLGLSQFFSLTVHARLAVMLFFVASVGAGLFQPVTLVFGLLDLAGAIWTWRAIASPRGSRAAAGDS
jgi:hypothetical protein